MRPALGQQLSLQQRASAGWRGGHDLAAHAGKWLRSLAHSEPAGAIRR